MREVAIAVFASGKGSNFLRLLDAEQNGQLQPGKVRCLISDHADAPVVEYAKAAEIPYFAIEPKALGGKSAWEKQVLTVLSKYEIELVVLAGFMRLVGPVMLEAYTGRMINLHPSYLPEFKGKDAIGQALASGVKSTGVTVHYVSQELDGGEVIEQVRVNIENLDTVESLGERIHQAEYQLLPKVVQTLCLQFAKEKRVWQEH